MADYTFKVNLEGITEEECFMDASLDELKVLVAVMSHGGEAVSPELIADELSISKARVRSALTLFEESGVIEMSEYNEFLAEVEYEFEPVASDSKVNTNRESLDVLRSPEVRDMIRDLESLFKKTFSTTEMQRLTSLISKSGLTPEYVLALSTFVSTKYKSLTVNRVVQEAKSLLKKNIDTLETLEVYIQKKSDEVAGEQGICSILSIRHREPTQTERAYFKSWLYDFGYGLPIINEAHEITVIATGDRSIPYMNSILTAWHEAGCKTLEECRAKAEMRKHEGKKAGNSSQSKKKKTEAETPKYTDFNSEDALMRALERSYGDSDTK